MDTKTDYVEKYSEMEKIITMNEVDPKYFTELADRIVKEKFSLHQYVVDTRDVLRTKLLLGQGRDNIICINQKFVEEQKRLDKIKRQYRRYTNRFEEFLSKNHDKSMKILDTVEDEAKQTKAITQTRNKFSKRYDEIRLEVYQCEESWRMVKRCQKFLYKISPDSWRLEHDWTHYAASNETIASLTSDVFDTHHKTDEGASLDTLIDLFEQDIHDAGVTEIYFKDSSDLIHVLRAMESQNLNSLIYLESLAAPMAEMVMTFTQAETKMKQEINEICERIEDLEKSIQTEELRAAVLEEYINKLLYEIFQELVCSADVLCLHVFIENTYESCVAPNDANLDSFIMMKQIEKYHEDLNMQLDNLPHSLVEACEKEGFWQEMKAMRDAEDAAKKFDLMRRLLEALKRIMEPILVKGRPLMRRSMPVSEQIIVNEASPVLTEEKQQFLTFFTDHCFPNKCTSLHFASNFSLFEEMQEHEDLMKSYNLT